VRSWDLHEYALLGAREAFNEIVARLVVSATIQRHVRYKPYFIKRLGGRGIEFHFVFKENEWRWQAWVCEREEPYEFSGTIEIDPIATFKQFERAVYLDMLV
jgi:hypothetical protein